jgi:hypothetical protein
MKAPAWCPLAEFSSRTALKFGTLAIVVPDGNTQQYPLEPTRPTVLEYRTPRVRPRGISALRILLACVIAPIGFFLTLAGSAYLMTLFRENLSARDRVLVTVLLLVSYGGAFAGLRYVARIIFGENDDAAA